MAIVSVIIPTFNRSGFAKETINSVKRQTLTDFEAILVDDGSNSDEIVRFKTFIEDDNRFKFSESNGVGRFCGARRNQGFHESVGRYLIFLDSDDILSNRCLENRINHLSRSSSEFCVSPAFLFHKKLGDLGERFFNPGWSQSKIDDLENFVSGIPVWQSSGPTFRRETFDRLNGYNADIECAEDMDMHIRMLLNIETYTKLSEPDYHYRQNESGSITTTNELRRLRLKSHVTLFNSIDRELRRSFFDDLKQLQKFDRLLWRYVCGKSISERHFGGTIQDCVSLISSYHHRDAISYLKKIEITAIIMLWFKFYGKVPAMSYANLRNIKYR